MSFLEPMECLLVSKLPEGPEWAYEVKLDGYRAQALCNGKTTKLLSRNGNDLGLRFPAMLPELAAAISFCASVRAGFVPASRRSLYAKLEPHETEACPFVNLPEASAGPWGQGLTAAKMKNCIWLRPEIAAQFRFLEWTPNDHLRHASFVGIRDDKAARSVVKEVESAAAKRKAPQRESVDSDRRRA